MRNLVRAIARFWFRARGAMTATIRGRRFLTDPYHIGFWRDVAAGRWEPELFDALDANLRPDSVFVDIGAWIGPVTIYAAARCARVYSLEPDPEAFQHLLWNLRLNRLANASPFNIALASTNGVRRLASPDGRLGHSTSTLLEAHGRGEGADVLCMRWEDWLRTVSPPRVDFIKLDIEGGEFELVPTMEEYLRREKPALLLSLHAPSLPEPARRAELRALLASLGHYTTIRDECGRPVTLEAVEDAAMSRYCSILASYEAGRA